MEVNGLLEHYQKGRFDLTENLAIKITQKYPDHQFSWKVLGVVFKQTGRLQESLIANQRAVATSPSDAEAHSNLGNTLKELGRLEDAEASYNKAIAIKPEYAEAT
jgi:Flp pilus assembly protein TadD